MKKPKLACFITGGLTEATSLKIFLNRINANIDYIQLCPITRKKSKKEIRERAVITEKTHNGITGEALLNYIYEFVEKEIFCEEEYDGILIEDDKDNRFLATADDINEEFLVTPTNKEHRFSIKQWEEHKNKVSKEIVCRCPQMAEKPIIFIYAAPEVETWFLADWNNSFASGYRTALDEKNNYFYTNLWRYISEHILGDYKNDLESFGYSEEHYIKLSEKIQEVIATGEYLVNANNQAFNESIYSNANVKYSKAINGAQMLEEIDPAIVYTKCRIAFGQGYEFLKSFNSSEGPN